MHDLDAMFVNSDSEQNQENKLNSLLNIRIFILPEYILRTQRVPLTKIIRIYIYFCHMSYYLNVTKNSSFTRSYKIWCNTYYTAPSRFHWKCFTGMSSSWSIYIPIEKLKWRTIYILLLVWFTMNFNGFKAQIIIHMNIFGTIFVWSFSLFISHLRKKMVC